LGETVSGAEIEGAPSDCILAALRVGHIARYAPCYNAIIRRHSANLTIQMVLVIMARIKICETSRSEAFATGVATVLGCYIDE